MAHLRQAQTIIMQVSSQMTTIYAGFILSIPSFFSQTFAMPIIYF